MRGGTIGWREFRIYWVSAVFAGSYCDELQAECWKLPSEQGRTSITILHGCQIIAVDLSREMLALAQTRAARLPRMFSFLLADAEALPFSARALTRLFRLLSTCTFPNPVTALEEMARVCRTDGKIFCWSTAEVIENGLAVGRTRDDRHAKQLGCHWNRETLELVRQAGLKIQNSRRVFFGVFHQIEAVPGPV